MNAQWKSFSYFPLGCEVLSWVHAPWILWILPISPWEGFTFFCGYFSSSEVDVWSRCVKTEAACSCMTATCMKPWDWHVQCSLGTHISKIVPNICSTVVFTICIWLLVAPAGVTAIELVLVGSWMGQAWQQMLFLVCGWELVCTCGLESNNLCTSFRVMTFVMFEKR